MELLPPQQRLATPLLSSALEEGGEYRTVKEPTGERGGRTLSDSRKANAWQYFRDRNR